MNSRSLMKALFTMTVLAPLYIMAQDDVEGSKDHSLLTRMPNYYILEYEYREFEAFEFAVANTPEWKQERVEGQRTIIHYQIKNGAATPGMLQIIRNYEKALKKIGGIVVWSDNFSISTVKIRRDTTEVWVEIKTGNGGEGYVLSIVEKEAMREDVTANDILKKLNTEGRIALYILFDTDKAVIKPESDPIIEQITSMMKENPALNISIEGHTDNVGDKQHNKDLSEKRARAVVNAITNAGISAKRMTATGFGQDKPVADNQTDEGRAKNRRVELVKK